MRTIVMSTLRFVHKHLWRTFILLLIVVVLLGVCFLYWLSHIGKPRKIADIPGPAGSKMQYELWYAKGGDLTFRPAMGNPVVRYYDYYNDVRVAQTQWLADDRLLITMHNGTTLTFASASRSTKSTISTTHQKRNVNRRLLCSFSAFSAPLR